jgi:hypothetical protein
MNMKLKVIMFGLVAVAAAQATVSDIWAPKNVQVVVPCIARGASYDYNADGKTDKYDCAGWWFGYVEQTASFAPIGTDNKLLLNDPKTGDPYAGSAWSKTAGLTVTLTATNGTANVPAIAGVGFEWEHTDATSGPTTYDMSAKKGICVSYSSTLPIQLELSWNEATYNYDTWYVELPASSSVSTVAAAWDAAAATGAESGDFMKDDYQSTTAYIQPIATALTKSVGLKFRLKNKETGTKTTTLNIASVGWNDGTCGGSNAVLQSGAAASSLKANLTGRTLAFSGLSNAGMNVEVINFQGQIVARGLVSASKSAMNLSSLSNGVYMVRGSGESVNFNQKILVK